MNSYFKACNHKNKNMDNYSYISALQCRIFADLRFKRMVRSYCNTRRPLSLRSRHICITLLGRRYKWLHHL